MLSLVHVLFSCSASFLGSTGFFSTSLDEEPAVAKDVTPEYESKDASEGLQSKPIGLGNTQLKLSNDIVDQDT